MIEVHIGKKICGVCQRDMELKPMFTNWEWRCPQCRYYIAATDKEVRQGGAEIPDETDGQQYFIS